MTTRTTRRRRVSLLIAAGFAIAILGNCSTSDERVIPMRVAAYKIPCQGEGVSFCHRVSTDGGGSWHAHDAGLEGFHFEWGVAYALRVRVLDVPHPPADGSSLRFIVEGVTEEHRVPAGTRFTLGLTSSFIDMFDPSSGSGRLAHEDQAILAETEEVRAAISSLLGDPERLTYFRARFGSRREDPIVVEQITDAIDSP